MIRAKLIFAAATITLAALGARGQASLARAIAEVM